MWKWKGVKIPHSLNKCNEKNREEEKEILLGDGYFSSIFHEMILMTLKRSVSIGGEILD